MQAFLFGLQERVEEGESCWSSSFLVRVKLKGFHHATVQVKLRSAPFRETNEKSNFWEKNEKKAIACCT